MVAAPEQREHDSSSGSNRNYGINLDDTLPVQDVNLRTLGNVALSETVIPELPKTPFSGDYQLSNEAAEA
jgi:hypothetical protein